MAAIVTNKFRINNALQFYESFGEASPTVYYLYVGRPQAFSTSTGGGTDSAPPTPIDNISNEMVYFRDMLAAKKITSSDVSYVVPRHDWTTGTVYDYYRGDYGATVNSATVQTVAGGTDMFATTTKMYVRTSANNVYKCMWNNGGAASTVEPTGTATTELTTADSYIWKYMCTMTTTEVANHMTPDFMGVHTDSTVSAAAIDGAVNRYHIATGGAGYTNGTYATQTLRGDGSSATFTAVVSGGAVTSVTSTAAGTDYTFADCNIDSISGIGTPSTSAVVTPIIGPKGGHGYNTIEELGGFYVMTNTTLSGSAGSGDFVVDQDFRRIGIVRDPFDYGTTTVCSASTRSAVKSVTFSGTPGTFINDEVITGGTSGAKGLVVDYDASSKTLKYIQTEWTGIATNKNLVDFATSEIITGTGSSATGTVSTVNNPEIDYYSGDIIYVENRAPILRATDQTENIKLIIEF
tara:strand:+ start:7631 stop:9022 length:1392 start_codon:yes stop_codon:yes gene_type:complete